MYHPHKSFNNVLLNGPRYKGYQTFWLTVTPSVTVHMEDECIGVEDEYDSILAAYLDYENWYDEYDEFVITLQILAFLMVCWSS